MVQYWKNIISVDFEKMDKEKSIVLLPIAATEQHGKHLPVGTDSMILEALLKKFAKEKDMPQGNVVIAPQIWVGKSNEHMSFPGTLTFKAMTLYHMVEELTDSITAHGFQKIMLVNAHGGNTDLLNLISRDIRIKHKVEVYVFDWWFTSFWQELLSEKKDSHSPYGVFHACELETSLMMEIAPETVDESAIADETPDGMFEGKEFVSLFGPITMGWETKDVTKSGVIGCPVSASAQKGKEMLQYATDKLEKIVVEVLGFQY